MKRFYNLLSFLVAVLLFGCSDMLNEPYYSNSSNDRIETKDTTTTALLSKINKTSSELEVLLPVYGEYASTSHETKWYTTTGSPAHIKYSSFDDLKAHDIGLRGDRDNELPVVAPLSGTITAFGTTYPGTKDGGKYGSVLIDCGNNRLIGLMHLKNIRVRSGDKVREGDWLGDISNVGVIDNHLHFVVYTRIYNQRNEPFLMSESVKFRDRKFNLQKVEIFLRPKNTYQIAPTVPFGAKGSIASARYYKNTYWSSDNNRVVKVDGNGKVTAVSTGKTQVRLKFSGQEFLFPVNVK